MQNLVFSCLPKAISNRRYSHILFLPTPASADSPIAKLGVCKTWCFHAFPKPFQIEDIHIYYSCPPLPLQILRFRVQNLVFSCLPKAFQIEDIHNYSCPPLPVQILQFRVQNLVFSCLPKAISNRRYSHILFLPTPARQQILQFPVCKTLVFSCLPKAISNRYSHILFLPTPAKISTIICPPLPVQILQTCAKLCVFMPSQSHFK